MIAVSDTISSRLFFSSDTVELIAVEVASVPKVLICCLYVAPASSEQYFNNVISAIDSLHSDHDIIFAGDFNAPDINWLTLTASSSFSLRLCDTLYSKNLQQIVFEPTHVHGNVLDLVLTTNPDRLQNLVVTDISSNSFSSDHFLIQFDLISQNCSRHMPPTGSMFNYAKGDYIEMDFYLLDKQFDMTSTDIETLWMCLKLEILEACELFVPKVKSSSFKYPKWFTSEIKHLLNCIHSLRRSIKKSSSITKANRLSSLELKVQSLIISAKEKYGTDLIAAFSHKPKDLYRHLRYLSKHTSMPQTLIYDSASINHPKDKVEAFNRYFNSTFTSSDFVLPPLDQMPTPLDQLSEINVTETDVFDALMALSPNKARGCDDISPHVLKYCSTSLTSPVTHLFHCCLSQSTLPHEWKVHKICPIPKRGDLSKITNYRPISLLCCLSKVLETIVYTKIISFIYPKLNKHQFGFLQNRSCLSQLLTFFAEIYNCIEGKNQCDVIYLDFKKAFDSVPHNEMLFKLWRFGITGPLWLWFKNYLSSRCHFVNLDSVSSSLLPVVSGVPQGSVLGPLLFLIYVNDIPDSIFSCSPYQFADDTKILKSIQSSNDSMKLQRDIDSLSEWCKKWFLTLNEDKCAAIHFSLSSINNLQSTYQINNTTVRYLSSHRDLGLMVEGNLSWSKHYNFIICKAYCSLHFIRRIIPISTSISLKKKLYLSLVRSHLTYCSQIWSPRLIKDFLTLERVQRRATKFIMNDFSLDYKSRLIQLNLLPLMYWLELQDILFLIKCFKDPSENFNPLSFVSFVCHSTRSATSHKLKVNYNRTSVTRHFYFNRVVKLWNCMPPIDLTMSYSKLKHTLKQIFWSHFITNFNPDNACSFHIVCPCSNCVNHNHSIT